jgi:hypothetical protein
MQYYSLKLATMKLDLSHFLSLRNVRSSKDLSHLSPAHLPRASPQHLSPGPLLTTSPQGLSHHLSPGPLPTASPQGLSPAPLPRASPHRLFPGQVASGDFNPGELRIKAGAITLMAREMGEACPAYTQTQEWTHYRPKLRRHIRLVTKLRSSKDTL